MEEANLPPKRMGTKTKRYTRKHLHRDRVEQEKERKRRAKEEGKHAERRARKEGRQLSAFAGIPAESTLALIGEE